MSGGLSQRARQSVAAALDAHVGADRVPGAVVAVALGDDVHVETAGRLTVGGPPVRRDSLFRIASTTKTLTTAVALSLVDEGRLHLDEPVDRLLPELADRRVLRAMDAPLADTVPADRPITVRQLMTFTFGFGMAVEMFGADEPWPIVRAVEEAGLHTLGPPQPHGPPDPDTWMARLGALPLMAPPGARWLYNTGASALGVLVARAAGAALPDVCSERLLAPLHMTDTAFFTTDTDRLATAYRPTPEGLEVWDPPDGAWSGPPAFPDGAAGLVSSADDLLAFADVVRRGGAGVLSGPAVAEFTRDQLTAAQRRGVEPFLGGRSWALGQAVAVDGPRRGAVGWDGGLGTSWLVDPARDLVVIVLTQRMFETASLPAVHVDVQAAVYDAVDAAG